MVSRSIFKEIFLFSPPSCRAKGRQEFLYLGSAAGYFELGHFDPPKCIDRSGKVL